MGDGDEWPTIREQLMAAEILVLATPTWVGQPPSIAQRVLERLDAELSEKDEQASTYWNDAVGSDHRDYQDLEDTPEAMATDRTVAAHAAHPARLLKQSPCPPVR